MFDLIFGALGVDKNATLGLNSSLISLELEKNTWRRLGYICKDINVEN